MMVEVFSAQPRMMDQGQGESVSEMAYRVYAYLRIDGRNAIGGLEGIFDPPFPGAGETVPNESDRNRL